jgi:hypothetical protein
MCGHPHIKKSTTNTSIKVLANGEKTLKSFGFGFSVFQKFSVFQSPRETSKVTCGIHQRII